MAIDRLRGQMLTANLLRDGVDLSFETDLLHLDVTNNRIGINTNSPSNDLQVVGISRLGNVLTSSNVISTNNTDQDLYLTPNGTGINILSAAGVTNLDGDCIVFADNSVTRTLKTDTNFSYTTASGLNLQNALNVGDLKIDGDTISTVSGTGPINILTNGQITLSNLDIVSLVANRITFTNTAGIIADSVNLTFNEVSNELAITGELTVDNLNLDLNTISTTVDPLILDPAVGEGIVINDTNSVQISSGSTAQRPVAPVGGMMRFNSSNNILEYWNGTAWTTTSSDFGLITSHTASGDDSTVAFTLPYPATTNSVIVSINGVVQMPVTAYSVSGTTLTFTTAPAGGDVIDMRIISSNYTITQLSDNDGDTFVDLEETTDDDIIRFTSAGIERLRVDNNGIVDASDAHSVQLPIYTVAEASALTNVVEGQLIYVSDGDSGSKCLAVYDGFDWKVVSMGATIATGL